MKKISDLDGEKWEILETKKGVCVVSNLGRVKAPINIGYRHSEWLYKLHSTKKGYLYVHLKGGNITVHRLVGIAFIKNKENKPYVNHKDGDKKNNRMTNLEWATNSENQKHAHRIGLISFHGMGSRRRILSDKDVIKIYKSSLSNISLSNKYMVHPSTISDIKRGKSWTTVTNRVEK